MNIEACSPVTERWGFPGASAETIGPLFTKNYVFIFFLAVGLSKQSRKTIMVDITKEACRNRGRPRIRSDDATLDLIVHAASDEFQAKGYAGASMCAVAQRAGVSTKTLYGLTPNKAHLFKTVVSERIKTFMLAFDEQVVGELELGSALERILVAYGHLTLEKETTAIIRLALSECERFPEIGEAFYEGAMGHVSEAMTSWLKEQCRKGLLELEDPYLAAGMLRGMMIMEPQRGTMLGRRAAPDAEEMAVRAKTCSALFLKGCLRDPILRK